MRELLPEARPKNWLEPVILAMLRERDSYGYEMMERLTEFGFEATNPGTMYRTLRRMEKGGLCESGWETSEEGPARRRYTVTYKGEAHLGLWVEGLEQYRRSVDSFLALYTNCPPQAGEENR